MADDNEESGQKTTCTFFKKAKRKGNVRKRKAESSGSEDEISVVRIEEKAATNPLKQLEMLLEVGRLKRELNRSVQTNKVQITFNL
jgi:hypothetical protein